MKHKSYGTLFLFSFLIMIGILCVIARVLSGRIPMWSGKPWPGMILAALAMLCAIPFHLSGRKQTWFYLISCLLNTVGAGLFVSSYFTYTDEAPSVAGLCLAAAIGTALMLLHCIFNSFDRIRKVSACILLIINAGASVTAVVLWLMYGGTFYPMLFFLLVPEFMQGLFLLICTVKSGSPFRFISFASYNYALVIGLAVLVILTEGEVLDGLFDGTELFSGRKRKLK